MSRKPILYHKQLPTYATQFLSPLSLNLGCSIIGDQSDFQLHFSLEIKMEVLLEKRKSLPMLSSMYVSHS